MNKQQQSCTYSFPSCIRDFLEFCGQAVGELGAIGHCRLAHFDDAKDDNIGFNLCASFVALLSSVAGFAHASPRAVLQFSTNFFIVCVATRQAHWWIAFNWGDLSRLCFLRWWTCWFLSRGSSGRWFRERYLKFRS